MKKLNNYALLLLVSISSIYSCASVSRGGSKKAVQEAYRSETIAQFKFSRSYILKLMDTIDRSDRSEEILNWRPGPGRAQIGWQLTHIAGTEDRMLNERFGLGRPTADADLMRYIKRKTPAKKTPDMSAIRWYLEETRNALIDFIRKFDMDRLDEKIPGHKTLNYRRAIRGLLRHESHHHGQAHITFNLYRVAKGIKK